MFTNKLIFISWPRGDVFSKMLNNISFILLVFLILLTVLLSQNINYGKWLMLNLTLTNTGAFLLNLKWLLN